MCMCQDIRRHRDLYAQAWLLGFPHFKMRISYCFQYVWPPFQLTESFETFLNDLQMSPVVERATGVW